MNPLTPLELLDIIEREHGFESPSLRLALTELEELKRDVKRYFELENKLRELHEIDEYYDLYDKLEKVGDEE